MLNEEKFWVLETVLSCTAVCQSQPGELKQLFEPLVKTFEDSP